MKCIADDELTLLNITDDELTLLNITDDKDDDDDDDDDDDPGPDPDDDPEGDCWSYHNCSGSQWGYCILRKGHGGSHYCGKCASSF